MCLELQITPDARAELNLRSTNAAGIVSRIIDGERAAVVELYVLLQGVVAQRLRNRLPSQEPEDLVHELLPAVIEKLRNGNLRQPEALIGYLHSMVRRQVATRILRVVRQRNRTVECVDRHDPSEGVQNPEGQYLRRERLAIIGQGLKRLGNRESDLLTRFYLGGEDLDQICREMGLTPTQFRLLKSRAKAKLTAWARSIAKVA
ncbi:MAG: sigma-70 family RNA polymerase sigma factor [Acidobacteria bacterium]|nr:sigma-70 family RNA polymerase sigma factor [Acidobacteriota bacterium]